MITAADLEKLRLGVQNRCRAVVRGVTFEFRPLTIAEQNEVTTGAISAFNKLLPDQKHSTQESTILAILTLTKASELQPGVPGVTEDTLKMLTANELGYLQREYNQMVDACNPTAELIPDDELIALADDLKKNQKTPTDLSSWQLMNLVRYLTTQLTDK